MLHPGVYPASVTPFDEKGKVDLPALARLLAYFEAQGCTGVVLAGTNGEGPSLAAVEKRDMVRAAMTFRGKLDVILGVATPSLEEAIWSCSQAQKSGAAAALVMAPSYFREATVEGIERWFIALMDATDCPVLVYNFPQRTGFTFSGDLLARLARHPNMIGAKDSSGDAANIAAYADALAGKSLFVGNESLLMHALKHGWSGTISGAANTLSLWLSQIVSAYVAGDVDAAETKFALTLPGIEAIRKSPQPATNKALLERLGVLPSARIRLPLLDADRESVDKCQAELKGLVRFP